MKKKMFALAFGLLTLAASVAIAPHKAEAQATVGSVIEIDISNNEDQHGRVYVDRNYGGFRLYGCRDSGGTCLADITIRP
ncbi:MAG: hypothetical protein DDT42_01538 [candidate division WS2 bacterium]|uniref:Secreted protein n=1 Tax=Psychracetigena formicireducens TaxID=2986056 RepID=A0A9E2F7J8_PSYF1|nr:hypothetical protein [Candidatus Psychracetigena formicireducens]